MGKTRSGDFISAQIGKIDNLQKANFSLADSQVFNIKNEIVKQSSLSGINLKYGLKWGYLSE